MTANIRLKTSVRNAMLAAIRDAIDAGSDAGTIKIYAGTMPANADTALSGQTLLAELTFSDPCAAAPSGGTMTFSTVTRDNSANATGTASFARIQDSAGNVVFDCDVGTSDAILTMPSVDIVATEPVEISSFTMTIPADIAYTP